MYHLIDAVLCSAFISSVPTRGNIDAEAVLALLARSFRGIRQYMLKDDSSLLEFSFDIR